MRHHVLVIPAVCACCLLLSCRTNGTTPPPPAADAEETASTEPAPSSVDNGGRSNTEPGDTTSADFEGTAGIVDQEPSIDGTAVLQEVRVARHETFDRVVFEFESGGLPGYHLEYVDRPVRACGSGEAVDVQGDGWLQVRLAPAQAHTDAGEPTVREREQMPGLPIIQELQLTCDFEADVTWVLGVASPNRYRVLELQNPPRLVVDVKH